ncbi:MAG TPA: hypothetical protein VME69_08015 [Methylocella sp.]|nr:hypothetical protein [Methylocella sp.]
MIKHGQGDLAGITDCGIGKNFAGANESHHVGMGRLMRLQNNVGMADSLFDRL